MSKRTYRIRLSGLEATCRDGDAVLVPWHCVAQVQHAIILSAARKVWPSVPRSVALSQTQSRVVRRLRERAARRRIQSGHLDIYCRAPWISFDAFVHAGVAIMITLPFVPLIARNLLVPTTAIESAVRDHLPIRFWIAVGLIALCAAGPLIFCVARLGRLALVRWRHPRPVAFRITSHRLLVYTDDGRENTFDWDRLTKCADAAFEFQDGRRFNVAFGAAEAPELGVLCRVLDPRRRRNTRRRDQELLAELRAVLPTAIRAWLFFGAVAAGTVIMIEPDPGRLPRMLAIVLVAPLLIGVQLAVLYCASVAPLRLERRLRRRRRRMANSSSSQGHPRGAPQGT
jgi:hypothetical protein